MLIGGLSWLFPSASLLMLVVVGGRAGLRFLLSAMMMSSIYILVRYAGVSLRTGYPAFIALFLFAIALWVAGMKKMYRRYGLKLDLADLAKKTGKSASSLAKTVSKKKDSIQPMMPGMMAIPMSQPSSDGIVGALSDLLFILSPLLFVYYPIHAIGVGAVLFALHRERRITALLEFAFPRRVSSAEPYPPPTGMDHNCQCRSVSSCFFDSPVGTRYYQRLPSLLACPDERVL